MPFQVSYRVAVHIVAHNGISHTVELHIHVVLFHKLLVGSLHTKGIQRINILAKDFPFVLKLLIHAQRHCLQHTARRRNTDVLKRSADALLQFRLDFLNGAAHLINVMDLSVQHGSRPMLPDALRHHMKLTASAVSHRTYNTPCPDIQTKYQLSRKFHRFCH